MGPVKAGINLVRALRDASRLQVVTGARQMRACDAKALCQLVEVAQVVEGIRGFLQGSRSALETHGRVGAEKIAQIVFILCVSFPSDTAAGVPLTVPRLRQVLGILSSATLSSCSNTSMTTDGLPFHDSYVGNERVDVHGHNSYFRYCRCLPIRLPPRSSLEYTP